MPDEQICANCKFWNAGGDQPEWCHNCMGFTDPAFTCEDWLDMRLRFDPETGEPWPALEPAPRWPAPQGGGAHGC